MQINFLNNFNVPKINNIRAFNIQKAFANAVNFTGYDTFEKSNADENSGIEEVQSTKGAENISSNKWSESRLEALYNKTFEEVTAQNPICEELNIQMPKFKMADYNPSGNMKEFAGYNFPSNEMIITQGAKGDLFLCIATKRDTGAKVSLGICDKEIMKENAKISDDYGFDMEAVKLTDKEKEAHLKTAFAHELRHSIQMHLIASTKDCSRPFKKTIARMAQEKWAEYNEINRMFEEINNDAENLGLEKMTVEPPETEYSDNFVPKKIINDDVKLKFSLSPKDTRYLSTREHLLNGFLLQMSKKDDREAYKASPLEMDANNYAYQYFCTQVKKDPEYAEIRPVISEEIQNFCFERAKSGINSMNQFGFPDLIRK